jgi:hypothetical protein
MDTTAFAKWLAGIGLLDSTQRGQALRELALAEANDPTEASDHATDDPALAGAAAAVPAIVVTRKADAGPDEDLLAKIGHDRIASFGCPHCGGTRPQGNRISKHGQELGEIGIIPPGALELSAQGALGRNLSA